MNAKDSPVIVPRIFALRGESVMLDLAALFGVTTGNFNKAIQRKAHRFPSDFAFSLTAKEFADLMFQVGISSSHGGRRKLPSVFTEHGAIMRFSLGEDPRPASCQVGQS